MTYLFGAESLLGAYAIMHAFFHIPTNLWALRDNQILKGMTLASNERTNKSVCISIKKYNIRKTEGGNCSRPNELVLDNWAISITFILKALWAQLFKASLA